METKPLPSLRKIRIPASQREFLQQWLEEERIWQKADEVAAAMMADAGDEFAELESLARPVDAEGRLKPGVVLLMHHEVTPDAGRPLYLAILREWEPGVWVCAPFSRNSVPALPAELQTGREEELLSVLQIWNSHTIHQSVLENAWYVDDLTQQELDDALRVFKSQFTGEFLEDLQDRVGPPIQVPSDPRVAYQAAEIHAMGTMKELSTAALDRAPLKETPQQEFSEEVTKKVIALAKRKFGQ